MAARRARPDPRQQQLLLPLPAGGSIGPAIPDGAAQRHARARLVDDLERRLSGETLADALRRLDEKGLADRAIAAEIRHGGSGALAVMTALMRDQHRPPRSDKT